MDPVAMSTVLVLAIFVGYEVATRVSATMSPAMTSGAIAVHGIVATAAVVAAGTATSTTTLVLSLVAVVAASANLVAGFLVTDRLLGRFARPGAGARTSGAGGDHASGSSGIRL